MKTRLAFLFTLLCAGIPAGNALEIKIEQIESEESETKKFTNAENFNLADDFDRDKIGGGYMIIKPDRSRMILSDGSLLIVSTYPARNGVVWNKPISENFKASIEVSMELTDNNFVAMTYRMADDPKSNLLLGIMMAPTNFTHWDVADGWDAGRRIFFLKRIDDGFNIIVLNSDANPGAFENRDLKGPSLAPETWHLSIRREGVKYTGYVSVDGSKWHRVGTHVLTNSTGKVGFNAALVNTTGNGIEQGAEFRRFEVQAD